MSESKLKKDIALLETSLKERWYPQLKNPGMDPPDCNFCDVYCDNTNPSHYYCHHCPIKEKTNSSFCKNTPYKAWEWIWIWNSSYEQINFGVRPDPHTEEMKNSIIIAVYNEITFLEELRADLYNKLGKIYGPIVLD